MRSLTHSSRIILLDEFEELLKRDSAGVVLVDLAEVPLHHFLGDRDVEWLEGVFHQFPELADVDQLVFVVALFFRFSRIFGPFQEEMVDLNKVPVTYSWKVILPSPSSSILEKCQSS